MLMVMVTKILLDLTIPFFGWNALIIHWLDPGNIARSMTKS